MQAMEASARQHSALLEQHTTEKDELRSALRRTEEQLDKMHSQVCVRARCGGGAVGCGCVCVWGGGVIRPGPLDVVL
jgi:hypothetical protein